jgi:hypothetical protein
MSKEYYIVHIMGDLYIVRCGFPGEVPYEVYRGSIEECENYITKNR